MRFARDGRLAWAVALASIALWAATAPATLGSLLRQEGSAALSNAQSPGGSLQALQETGGELQCEAAPTPTTSTDALPTDASPTPPAPDTEAAFRICGGPDPATERAIEQIIAGRGFRARLASRGDGCADLTITVPSTPPGSFSGRQSTRLTVSAGSTGVISIEIVTENGATRVAIGGGAPSGQGGTPGPTATPVPTATPEPAPTATPMPSQVPGEATFRVCGGPDPATERAIEQIIAGRGFRARLVGRGDGCADLTISVSPQSPPGSASGWRGTQLSISTGSGSISLRIVTENGVTKATIGASR